MRWFKSQNPSREKNMRWAESSWSDRSTGCGLEVGCSSPSWARPRSVEVGAAHIGLQTVGEEEAGQAALGLGARLGRRRSRPAPRGCGVLVSEEPKQPQAGRGAGLGAGRRRDPGEEVKDRGRRRRDPVAPSRIWRETTVRIDSGQSMGIHGVFWGPTEKQRARG